MSAESTPTAQPAWVTPIESRRERAEYYFKTVLEDQLEWYSQKAGIHKQRHIIFGSSVVVLGAAISVLQVIDAAADWVRYLTAVLGAGVSVFRAIDALLRPGETWQVYRKASGNMKREYRLYLQNADIYAEAPDEDAAYRLLVARVETVIAEEQQLFWQFQAKRAVSPAAKSKEEVV